MTGSTARHGFAALAALSAILLGLTEIGVTPIAPGTATGFRELQTCAADVLCFEADGGDLQALVTLQLRSADPGLGEWAAELTNGVRLHVDGRPVSSRETEIRISKPDSTLGLVKFAWPSGVALVVRESGGQRPDLIGWRVDLPDREGPDTRLRARWRAAWTIICVVLLCIGAFAAVFEALRAGPGRPDVRELCSDLVRLTISQVNGRPSEEPEVMRALLVDVLLGTVPSHQAFLRYTERKSYARAKRIWFTARARFEEHWSNVLRILGAYTDRLG